MDPDAALRAAGRRAFNGFELRRLERTTSTQDEVRAAARAGAATGFCCVAAHQTAGRGRQQRSWSAPPGTALLASVLLRVPAAAAAQVPIAAGLALRAAVSATSGVEAAVKWPNDLMWGSRKLAGVLCEVEAAARGPAPAVVAGFGVNLAAGSFPAGVPGVSLDELCPAAPGADALLGALLGELSSRVSRLDGHALGALRTEWMRHAAGVGEPVRAVSPAGVVEGVGAGIDDDGALLVRTASGVVRVLAGDVHLTPPAPQG